MRLHRPLMPASFPVAVRRHPRSLIQFGVLLALLGVGSAIAPRAEATCDRILYSCILTGQQETPAPVASPALGGGRFVIDTAANTVEFHIVYTGLTSPESAAHIHGPADPGVGGGVMFPLPAGSPKVGVWNYLEAEEAAILSGRTYVNIHSAMFGSGEIRGQIVPLNASLTSAQEPVASPAQGWGVFTIDTAANMLNYHIAFAGLLGAETAAHIHGAGLHTEGAGVFVGLPLGSPKIGSWNYLESQEAAILTGQTYVNIHSAMFGAGEIRGQIVPLVVPLDGTQESPMVATPAAGIALVGFDTVQNQLSYDLRFAGLSSPQTAAHIHGYAPPGMGAGVVHPIAMGSPAIGLWNYTVGDEPQLLSDLAYFNVHSMVNAGGEIRGQLAPFFCRPTVGVADAGAVSLISLAASVPNPAGETTTIRFALTEATPVKLAIFDTQGRLVRTLLDADMSAGTHPVTWDALDNRGRRVANGVYYYVLETPRGQQTHRLAVLR